MITYTVFCREEDNYPGSTTWIGAVYVDKAAGESDSTAVDAAIDAGIAACAEDWSCPQARIICIGVAKGSAKILEWSDSGL